ncbi:MAG: histidine phosphatase family protein [Erysipelotrichaceae bacterium]|nr:histidine phosphatase family protein [Erysipelotrichaceae bacterium]
MKRVTFYYVRHGRTLFNEVGKMQGWSDSPLTEEGIANAYQAKKLLEDINFNHIYTSTSERCIDTANIIKGDRDIPISYEKGLKEVNFGRFEGVTMSNHQEEVDRRRFGDFDWSDVGGENVEMLAERVLKTYDAIFEKSADNDNILIVSHGSVFMHMISFMFGLDRKYYLKLASQGEKKDMPAPNGYVAKFSRIGDEYHLDKLNKRDDSFLEKLYAAKL